MFAVKGGNINKLAILFERYHVPLYNYFMKLWFDAQASEDLVQEVFMKLIKFRHTYRGDGVFTTWLFQIAHNTFYDYVRSRKTHDSTDVQALNLSDGTDIHETVTKKEDQHLIKEALKQLPEEDREVLILRNYHNMKYTEIADIVNSPVGTVKARVHYALKKLKTVYNQLIDKT